MTNKNVDGQEVEVNASVKSRMKTFFVKLWKNEKLMICIVIGVIIGMLVGTLTNPTIRNLKEPVRTDAVIGAEFLGNMFLQCLRLIILPLIVSSLIRGMASLDTKSAGRVGLSSLIYYFVTTVLAVILAIVLVVTISPGTRANYAVVTDGTISQSRTVDLFLDIVRNLFPENIIQATFQTVKTPSVTTTVYDDPHMFTFPPGFELLSEEERDLFITENSIFNITMNNDGTLSAFQGTKRSFLLPGTLEYNNGMNMLGIITFSIAFGLFLGRVRDRSVALLSVFESIELVTIKIISLIMWVSPLGICSLIIGQFWKIDNISSAFASLGLYLVTVVAGLFIHLFLTIFLIYFIFTRKNPFIYLKNLLKAVLTAFATASSSATIPITLECLDDKNNIDHRISRFMIPVGATVNMNGTALYEAVAALFLAQVYGVKLTAGNIIVMSITATMTSVGAAGVPGGALVTLVIVLQVLGLPADSLGLILSIDWLLDRCMTIVNVLGDAFGCGIVQSINKKYFSVTSCESSFNETVSEDVQEIIVEETPIKKLILESSDQNGSHDHRL